MKRAASILLMCLLAFNWVGYRLVSGYIESEADRALEAKINNADYNESNLIQIRVPLNAPYLASTSSEFQRIDGEIELNGTHYKYVKRKVENGELVLLCLPNEDKSKIQNSRVDFFKLVNNLNQSTDGKTKNQTSIKSFNAEYRPEPVSWSIASVQPASSVTSGSCVSNVCEGFNALPEQPPKA